MVGKRLTGARAAQSALTLVEIAVVVLLIVIILVLLVPALLPTSHHGAAYKRIRCSNNLKMVASALETYTQTYTYFPGWAGMGDDPAEPRLRGGWFKDPKTGERVATVSPYKDNSACASGSVGRLRAIGVAAKQNQPISTWTAGKRNMNPVGLGYCVEGGMIEDLSVFYCPSGSGMGTVAYDSAGKQYFDTPDLDNLSEIRQLGETDRASFLYGDYSKIGANGRTAPGWTEVTMCSQYSYRPTTTIVNSLSTGTAALRYPLLPETTFHSGSPGLSTRIQLGNRALLSDAFDKCYDACTASTRAQVTSSAGYYAHTEAYNVRYADNHVAMYHDDKKIMNWPPPDRPSTGAHAYGLTGNNLWSAGVEQVQSGAGPDDPKANMIECEWSFAVWRMFDQAAGIQD